MVKFALCSVPFYIVYCLFVCFGFIVPLIWRRHHYRWRAANFDLHVCSALMAIEQWEFFSVPYLLWHGAVISKDPWHSHLLPSVSQWSCYYLFLRLLRGLLRLGFEHPTYRLRGQRSNPLCHRRGSLLIVKVFETRRYLLSLSKYMYI